MTSSPACFAEPDNRLTHVTYVNNVSVTHTKYYKITFAIFCNYDDLVILNICGRPLHPRVPKGLPTRGIPHRDAPCTSCRYMSIDHHRNRPILKNQRRSPPCATLGTSSASRLAAETRSFKSRWKQMKAVDRQRALPSALWYFPQVSLPKSIYKFTNVQDAHTRTFIYLSIYLSIDVYIYIYYKERGMQYIYGMTVWLKSL